MVVFGSLTRWWVAYNHPIGSIFATYIPLIFLANWVIICYRSRLVREPGISISPSRGTGGGLFWENCPVPKPTKLFVRRFLRKREPRPWKKNLRNSTLKDFRRYGSLTKGYQVIQWPWPLYPQTLGWSLNHFQGSLNHAKKVRKSCQVTKATLGFLKNDLCVWSEHPLNDERTSQVKWSHASLFDSAHTLPETPWNPGKTRPYNLIVRTGGT